jgi:hypothetical protein
MAGDVIEQRELGDERRELGDEQRELSEEWQELGDKRRELGEERQELGDESPVWPKTWSSSESSATSLTRSDESSGRSP